MRLPIATDLKTRTGNPDKDARLKNSYVEVKGDQSIVRKRPGAQGGVSVGTGTAQGGIGLNINGVPSFIGFWGDTINPGSAGGGLPYTGAGANWTNGSTYAAGGTGPDASTYATFDPFNKGIDIALSNGNLTATFTSSVIINELVKSTIGKSSGKWFWEITLTSVGDVNASLVTGLANSLEDVNSYLGGTANSWGHTYSVPGTGCNTSGNASKKHNGTFACYGSNVTNGNVLGFALDMDVGTITVYKNGISQGIMFSGITGTIYPSASSDISVSIVTSLICTANFGASAFIYSVPSGYNSGLYI